MSKYKEILELKEYCDSIGVEVKLEPFIDGYALCFKNGGDVVQHRASLGNDKGCEEFGYTTYTATDFKAIPIEAAKDFVFKHKEVLNKWKRRKRE